MHNHSIMQQILSRSHKSHHWVVVISHISHHQQIVTPWLLHTCWKHAPLKAQNADFGFTHHASHITECDSWTCITHVTPCTLIRPTTNICGLCPCGRTWYSTPQLQVWSSTTSHSKPKITTFNKWGLSLMWCSNPNSMLSFAYPWTLCMYIACCCVAQLTENMNTRDN